MKIAGSILIPLLVASSASAMHCRCKWESQKHVCKNGQKDCDNAENYDNKHCVTNSKEEYICFGPPVLDWLTQRFGFHESDIPANGSYVCMMSLKDQYWVCVCKGELCNYDMTLAEVKKWIWQNTTNSTTSLSTLATGEITTTERITNNAAGRQLMTVINYLMLIAMVCSGLGLHQLMFY